MRTRNRFSLLALSIAGALTLACGDDETSSPVASNETTTRGATVEYVIAGAGGISTPLYIDDFVRVFVDDAPIGKFDGCVLGMKGCSRLPIRFDAPPGSRLTIEGYDTGGSYGMDEVFLYRPGTTPQELFEGFRCNVPSMPCPTPFGPEERYVRRSFVLQ